MDIISTEEITKIYDVLLGLYCSFHPFITASADKTKELKDQIWFNEWVWTITETTNQFSALNDMRDSGAASNLTQFFALTSIRNNLKKCIEILRPYVADVFPKQKVYFDEINTCDLTELTKKQTDIIYAAEKTQEGQITKEEGLRCNRHNNVIPFRKK